MSLPTLIVEAGFTAGASTADYLTLDDTARGLLDTGTLAPDGIFTDISDYVHRVRIRRGVSRVESPILRYDAGTATIELNNSDRRFDPTNLSGPYVATGITQVTPMRAIRIRAVWAGVTYDLFRGFADSWTIEYEEPNYSVCVLEATDGVKVLSSIDRTAVSAVGAGDDSGARVSRILDSAQWSDIDRVIGTGDVTHLNTTLEGNTWNELLLTQDTEVGEVYLDAAGRVVFRPRTASIEELRSQSPNATFGDDPVTGVETTINLATNPSMETNTTGWAAGGSAPPTLSQSSTQAKFGTFSLKAVWDTNGVLPLVQYTINGLTIGKTYTVSVYVYVPAGSPGVATIVALTNQFGEGTTLKDQWVRLRWTGVATDTTWAFQLWPSEVPTSGQELYVDGLQVEEGLTATTYCDGTQTNCEWDGTAHASTSRRIPELPYRDVRIEYDDDTLANLVMATRVGGAEQTAQDAASQQLYLVRTARREDLSMQTDAVALQWAQWILYQSKDPELRFTALVLRPQRDPDNLFPQALGREFGDRVRVIRRPPGGGTITREVFIRGVEHAIGDGTWLTGWALQSATKWAFLILDHGVLGQLDENALG